MNAKLPILLTESGIVIADKLQFWNAFASIVVTVLGILTAVRLPQPDSILSLMVVIESGRLTEVRLVQFENALLPMLVTELGIVMDAKL